ncbi:MAG: HAMP domain-containing methyl-accepting chemotaxis protein [bacterium]
MIKVRNFSVSFRLFFLFSILAFVVIVAASFILYSSKQSQRLTSNIVDVDLVTIKRINDVSNKIEQSAKWMSLYLLEHNKETGDKATISLQKAVEMINQGQFPRWIDSNKVTTLKNELKKLENISTLIHDLAENPTKNQPALGIANTALAPQARIIAGQFQLIASLDIATDTQIRAIKLQIDWQRILSDFRAYLFNRREDVWNNITDYVDSFETHVSQWLLEDDLDFEAEESLSQILAAVQTYKANMPEIHRIHSSNAWRKDLELSATQLNPLLHNIDSLLSEINSTLKTQTDKRAQKAIIKIKRSGQGVIWGTVIFMVLMSAIFLLTRRTIMAPLNRVLFAMTDVASNGNLNQRLNDRYTDEFGRLAHSFNSFSEKIKGVVDLVILSSRNLVSDSDRLISVTAESEQKAQQQQQSIDEVVGHGQALSDGMKEIEDTSEKANNAANLANQVAVSGGDIIAQTISGIHDISRQNEQISREVEMLSENSRMIHSYVDGINSITEQTNMLALNAAIEAARAGEAGRGFAVVADEVRALASRVKEQSGEIQSKVNDLCLTVDHAVEFMQQNKELMDQTSTQAQEAEKALQSITNAIQDIVEHNSDVSHVAKTHASTAHHISNTIKDIGVLAHDVASSAHESSLVGREFTSLAAQLEGLVAQFLRNKQEVAVPEQKPNVKNSNGISKPEPSENQEKSEDDDVMLF